MSEQQDDNWKCSLVEGRLKYCFVMKEVIESGGVGTRYQGVKSVHLINMKTFEHARQIVVVKSGKHAKHGMIANFCPFCGTKIFIPAETDGEAA